MKHTGLSTSVVDDLADVLRGAGDEHHAVSLLPGFQYHVELVAVEREISAQFEALYRKCSMYVVHASARDKFFVMLQWSGVVRFASETLPSLLVAQPWSRIRLVPSHVVCRWIVPSTV